MKKLIITSAISAVLGTTVAYAQDTEQNQSVSGRQGRVLEEIVVSARKRDESFQNVPISMAAFSAADLENRNLTSLNELGQFVPNLSWGQSDTGGKYGSTVFIRGVGQLEANDSSRSPAVGIYIDGVYQGRMQGLDVDLMETARVEILRGPQGTLFGKNTIGGAINMVSVKPNTENLYGFAEVIAGSDERLDVRLSANVPIVEDKLALQFGVASRNQEGFGKQIDYRTGKSTDVSDTDRVSGRLALRWLPSEEFDVLLSLDHTRARENGTARNIEQFFPDSDFLTNSPYLFVTDPTIPNYADPAYLTRGDYDTYSSERGANELDTSGASLIVDWDLGNYFIKSITGYRDSEAFNAADPDGTPHELVYAEHRMNSEQFSQEFQIGGLAFNDRLDWIAGIYYFDEDVEMPFTTKFAAEMYYAFGADLGFRYFDESTNTSGAVFGQATYSISDRLSATFGLRYTDEEKTFLTNAVTYFELLPYDAVPKQKADFDATTGRIGLEYQWSDDTMTYVSVAEGFQSGGINVAQAGLAPYDPEDLITYELGWKTEFLNNSLRFNGALYYSDYEDIQFSSTVAGENFEPITVIGNVAEATIWGFEMDLIASPLDGLTLTASVGYTDAQYDKVDPAVTAATGIDKDTTLALTPERSAVLSVEYFTQFNSGGSLASRLDYSYKSAIEHNMPENPFISQGSYSIVNARIAYTSPNQSWDIALFGTNLTDEHYVLSTSNFSGLGMVEAQYAEPRQYGITAKFSF